MYYIMVYWPGVIKPYMIKVYKWKSIFDMKKRQENVAHYINAYRYVHMKLLGMACVYCCVCTSSCNRISENNAVFANSTLLHLLPFCNETFYPFMRQCRYKKNLLWSWKLCHYCKITVQIKNSVLFVRQCQQYRKETQAELLETCCMNKDKGRQK